MVVVESSLTVNNHSFNARRQNNPVSEDYPLIGETLANSAWEYAKSVSSSPQEVRAVLSQIQARFSTYCNQLAG